MREGSAHADVRFVAAAVSVRLGHRQPEREDSLAAHRILAQYPAVREALARYRAAWIAVDQRINDVISEELGLGVLVRIEPSGDLRCTCDPGPMGEHHDYCEIRHPDHPCDERSCRFAAPIQDGESFD